MVYSIKWQLCDTRVLRSYFAMLMQYIFGTQIPVLF